MNERDIISKDEVIRIARLAKLELEEKEIETITGQLNRIMDYFRSIEKLELDDVEPMTHALERENNVLREDIPGLSLSGDELLRIAPKTEGACYVVPGVIQGG